jgi:hypothetical protein
MNTKGSILFYTFLISGIYLLTVPAVNWIMTIAGIASLVLILSLFFIRENPNVLLIGLLGQWITPMARLLYANHLGIPMREVLWDFYGVPEKMDEAYYLTLIGVVVYALGLYVAVKSGKALYAKMSEVKFPSTMKLLKLYGVFWAGFIVFEFVNRFIPGLSQLLAYFEPIRFGMLLVLLYQSIKVNEKKNIVLTILALEILFSFTSYFSSFKDYIFVLIMLFLAMLYHVNLKKVSIGIALFFIIGFAGLWWGAVKVDFREQYGSGVASNPIQAIFLFDDIYSNLSDEDKQQGVERTIGGMGYIHFFSHVLNYVPDSKPFQGGDIWTTAVLHTLTPRLLFPNKPILRDTEHMMEYTGLDIWSGDVSYSLGYIADSYIDFGPAGMFIPIFLFAFLTGRIYIYVVKNNPHELWSIILSVPFFFLININGKNAIKAYSALIIYLIIVALLKRFVLPKLNSRFI